MSPVRPTLLVVGRRHEPEDHRLREFLTRISLIEKLVATARPAVT